MGKKDREKQKVIKANYCLMIQNGWNVYNMGQYWHVLQFSINKDKKVNIES